MLKAAAIRLVNTLASSQHAASFQAAVTQLPQAAKQRLQVCEFDVNMHDSRIAVFLA